MTTREIVESMLPASLFASEVSREIAVISMCQIVDIERNHARSMGRLDAMEGKLDLILKMKGSN